jgi:hypothetical protein
MVSGNNGFSNNPVMIGYDNGVFVDDEHFLIKRKKTENTSFSSKGALPSPRCTQNFLNSTYPLCLGVK